MIRKDKVFYDWLFHYNAYSDLWFAFHREDSHAYWNGHKPKHTILSAKDLKELMQLLQSTRGDKKKLNERTDNTGTSPKKNEGDGNTSK